MKMHVILDDRGKVVGTARGTTVEGEKDASEAVPIEAPIPLGTDEVREIELPSEFEQITDPGELHAALERHLREGA
jgi:hypothetical protein